MGTSLSDTGSARSFYEPSENRSMRVACLMSGSGTNVRKILEHQLYLESEGRIPYEVVVIFSDNWESRAPEIGKDYDVPVVIRDINAFYKKRGKKKRYFLKNPELDAGTRQAFDKEVLNALHPYQIDLAAYGGYMTASSEVLVNGMLGVNVHPADLSIMEGGKRKYIGARVVRDAIIAGEKELRSSTHIIKEQVDYGELLVISQPLKVELSTDFSLEDLRKKENRKRLNEIANEHQDRLKEIGDWQIFPKTVQWIAEGRFTHGNGLLYFNDEPIPYGLKLDK